MPYDPSTTTKTAAGVITIKGVELVTEGTWQASTGMVKFTQEDFASMIEAAKDPEVDKAAVRIGHLDPRFDGEPALGWVTNLRTALVKGKNKLIGDIEQVPVALAEVIPKAFRQRSVEVAWVVRTPSGKRYRAALVGLALLGVMAPAVKGLADIIAMYDRTAASSPTAGFPEAGTLQAVTVDDLAGGDPAVSAAMGLLRAAISAVGIAANLAPDAMEGLASTLETSLSGAISSANPPLQATAGNNNNVPVDETRIRELLQLEADADVEKALTELKTKADGTPAPVTPAAPAVTVTPTAPAVPAGTPDPNAPSNIPTPAGVAPVAPAPVTAPAPAGAQPTTTAPAVGAAPVVPAPVTAPAAPAAPAAVTPELVTLSAGNLAELRAQAQSGQDARVILRTQEIESVLTTALSRGRIAPADVEAWRERLQKGETFETTKTLLSSLTPAFATSEVGAVDAVELNIDDKAWSKFDLEVFGIQLPQPAEAK